MTKVSRDYCRRTRAGEIVSDTSLLTRFLNVPKSAGIASSRTVSAVTPWNFDGDERGPDANIPTQYTTHDHRGRGRGNSVTSHRSRTPSPISPRPSSFICSQCSIPRSSNVLHFPSNNVCQYCVVGSHPITQIYQRSCAGVLGVVQTSVDISFLSMVMTWLVWSSSHVLFAWGHLVLGGIREAL
jgi:hypothetical protein